MNRQPYCRGDHPCGAAATPSLVKQYVYCPTLPWLEVRVGRLEHPTPSMESAVLTADEKEEIAREVGIPPPYRVEVPLECPELRLRGVIDLVAGPHGRRGYWIMEAKKHPRRPRASKHFQAQLLAYALLATKTLGPVYRATLYIGGATKTLDINQRHLQTAEKLVKKTLKTVEEEEPPLTRQPPQKCRYCFYRKLCPNANPHL
ncbi:CRISPR-associated protein Cas4 [Aeropyrum pernix]|uniref:CRISPR-associated exonuclease Cas4 n=1 Tax=Aeropyrum pernix TaxID=56636 RepID=A0A401H8K8_AERPX|nr:CRISPR-associated protein Cas4 [Aeropyrum pernix]GBF08806.1 CRISPR-associated protein Cas4 [Aeropyrum pernix]